MGCCGRATRTTGSAPGAWTSRPPPLRPRLRLLALTIPSVGLSRRFLLWSWIVNLTLISKNTYRLATIVSKGGDKWTYKLDALYIAIETVNAEPRFSGLHPEIKFSGFCKQPARVHGD